MTPPLPHAVTRYQVLDLLPTCDWVKSPWPLLLLPHVHVLNALAVAYARMLVEFDLPSPPLRQSCPPPPSPPHLDTPPPIHPYPPPPLTPPSPRNFCELL